MTIGIYKLNFIGTDKVYIGQSINIERRFTAHKNSFKNSSASKKLLAAYTAYGYPTLSIECVCESDSLSSSEDRLIQLYDSFKNGFNSLEYAEDIPITTSRPPDGVDNRYTFEQIFSTFELLVDTQLTCKEISSITGVSDGSVYYIKAGRGHKWLKDAYPNSYTTLINKLSVHGNSAKARGIVYPKVICPQGIIYTIENRSQFAVEHKLDCGALGRVLRGTARTHKGWKLA